MAFPDVINKLPATVLARNTPATQLQMPPHASLPNIYIGRTKARHLHGTPARAQKNWLLIRPGDLCVNPRARARTHEPTNSADNPPILTQLAENSGRRDLMRRRSLQTVSGDLANQSQSTLSITMVSIHSTVPNAQRINIRYCLLNNPPPPPAFHSRASLAINSPPADSPSTWTNRHTADRPAAPLSWTPPASCSPSPSTPTGRCSTG